MPLNKHFIISEPKLRLEKLLSRMINVFSWGATWDAMSRRETLLKVNTLKSTIVASPGDGFNDDCGAVGNQTVQPRNATAPKKSERASDKKQSKSGVKRQIIYSSKRPLSCNRMQIFAQLGRNQIILIIQSEQLRRRAKCENQHFNSSESGSRASRNWISFNHFLQLAQATIKVIDASALEEKSMDRQCEMSKMLLSFGEFNYKAAAVVFAVWFHSESRFPEQLTRL